MASSDLDEEEGRLQEVQPQVCTRHTFIDSFAAVFFTFFHFLNKIVKDLKLWLKGIKKNQRLIAQLEANRI